MDQGKKWWESKTLWFNAISGAVGVVTAFSNSALASDPRVQAGAALFVTIGNGVLRFLTEKPIQ